MYSTVIIGLIIAAASLFVIFLLYCCCCRKRHSSGSAGTHYPGVSAISKPQPSFISSYSPSDNNVPHHYQHDIETGYLPDSYTPSPVPPSTYQPASYPPIYQQDHAVGRATWSVAIKKPGNRQSNILSTKAWYLSLGDNKAGEIENIMDWVHLVLDSEQWEGFFVYNDQPPGRGRNAAGGPDPSTKGAGHCKGIVTWNQNCLGWLVHSVPRWPEGRNVSLSRANYSFPEIEDSQLLLAQSFAWIRMPINERRNIVDQLVEMQAFVFYGSPNPIWPYPVGVEIGAGIEGRSVPRMIPLGPGLAHIAKNGAWNECIYHEFMGRAGLGKGTAICWKVQTWSKQSDLRGLQFDYVADVRSLEFPDSKKYKNGSAHSKWAISSDAGYSYVFIGDLNRATSQNKRGGGGILIQSRPLWEFMNSLCVSYFYNGISYEQ